MQALLEGYIKLRAMSPLRPYIRELSRNVTRFGVPTMRPPSHCELPADRGASMIDDQYMLGPSLLVAPVTKQGATSREVYFPCDQGAGSTRWESFFDASVDVACGSQSVESAGATGEHPGLSPSTRNKRGFTFSRRRPPHQAYV